MRGGFVRERKGVKLL